MAQTRTIELSANDLVHHIEVHDRMTLADALRELCGLTSINLGCEHGVCGSCTVLINGKPVRSCLMFAVQAEKKEIQTAEGLATGTGELHPLQEAFHEHHGLQCGFCTPGFLMLAAGYLEENPHATEVELREVLSSNLCRCTGYKNIVNAVVSAADQMRV